jgi:GT2 family glycosyltransferase
MPGKNSLSVVVPVYNAAEELAHCLDSLHATLAAGTEVILIDDASPDCAVQALLGIWKQRAVDGWRFERNTSNLGFVGTANRGMRLAQGDVVLLNSDTVTTPGWLQGLQRCLYSDESIGTATPWTNNGEIASIPAFCAPNPVPADPAAVAHVVALAGAAVYPSIPTAVGFCMAISRRAIDRVGLFDEALFGKGYGEENDFSMRVSQAGMRNVLCDDVYVVHVGGCSFGPLGLKPDESSMQRLLSRHPAYLDIVQEFIRQDPLSVRRQEIVTALEREGDRLG